MGLFILSFLIFGIFFLGQISTLVQGEDKLYLYTDKHDLDGSRIDDAYQKEDVRPVVDYVKPMKKTFESEASYDERILKPTFLSDSYDKPRVVEFYGKL